LPEQLRGYTVQSSGQPSFPLAMMDWLNQAPAGGSGAGDERSRSLAVLDGEGQIAWYYILPSRIPASQTPLIVDRLASGNWLYMTRKFGFEEVTPDARVARRFHLVKSGTLPHHDFYELVDRRLLFLDAEDRLIGDTADSGRPKRRVRGDTLRLLDPETGAEEQVWSAFDALDPSERPGQWLSETEDGAESWTHANSVSLGSRGNVIVSFRHLDQVISLSPDFKRIEWKLGGPGSSFSFPDATDRFYGQHTATELANGHVLLFDNGNFRPEGEFSRALELELDFATMTARKVWEYRHRPDLYAARLSSALRLPNGNTVVNFGFPAGPDEPVVLVETRPDGTPAWVQAVTLKGARASRYRASPLASLAGEAPAEPIAGCVRS
jgi:hypothetical protein